MLERLRRLARRLRHLRLLRSLWTTAEDRHYDERYRQQKDAQALLERSKHGPGTYT